MVAHYLGYDKVEEQKTGDDLIEMLRSSGTPIINMGNTSDGR